MKKIFLFSIFVFLLVFAANAKKGPDEIIKNVKESVDYSIFANMNKINVYVTFNETKFWGKSFDEWVEEQREKGKKSIRQELISGFFNKFDKDIKKGKKWGIERIENLDEAKEGYLFVINVDSILPVTGVGTKSDVTITVTQVGDPTVILSGNMECFQPSIGIPVPILSFKEAGNRILDKLLAFLKAC
ncbi:MAG TPA: hypothetical protein PLO89_03945 [Spirochaetota bacterium]|nr:hypothetical protein [Spirochaetota bacterium]